MSSSSTLYLEQYLDSLDSLPAELRRNFTLMHDLDTKNRSILRDVDSASDDYLRKVRDLDGSERKEEMSKIQAMFQRAKEHGDNKVSIAIQTYELVDKHIRRLDADLAKFEAEMKEKGRLSQTETESEAESLPEQEDKKKKKKTAASKGSSKEAAGKQKGKKKSLVDADEKRGKKKKGSASSGKADSAVAGSSSASSSAAPVVSAGPLPGLAGMISGVPQEVLDMPVDPNEPTYCLCNQVSFGEMIGCDNPDCPIEWFHFGCLGLTTKPKGKWFCPKCISLYKKKK